FQAEDGIRDFHVTGVQTCALPILRADSRYNRDVAFLTANYANSADVFVVMVKTQPDTCSSYPVTSAVDRFQAVMADVEGVVGMRSEERRVGKVCDGGVVLGV